MMLVALQALSTAADSHRLHPWSDAHVAAGAHDDGTPTAGLDNPATDDAPAQPHHPVGKCSHCCHCHGILHAMVAADTTAVTPLRTHGPWPPGAAHPDGEPDSRYRPPRLSLG